jgi:hypothetical protein
MKSPDELVLKSGGSGTETYAAHVVNLRCPACNHIGAFHGFPNCPDVSFSQRLPSPANSAPIRAGIRMCPNDECHCVVFVFLKSGKLLKSFPPEMIDFDSTNLPPSILATLEEAIKAHSAECYKATALMVRRLLEELCEDKTATGNDLKARLASLGANIVVPQDLLTAADELRILGNDAAHIEAKAYDAIGKEEASLAIELAKELLKAVYQYSSLLSKLKALKK